MTVVCLSSYVTAKVDLSAELCPSEYSIFDNTVFKYLDDLYFEDLDDLRFISPVKIT